MPYNKLFIAQLFIVTSIFVTGCETNCDQGTTNKNKEPDVSFPGSDTESFANSPFTLPPGRGYFENHFLAVSFKGNNTPFQYNAPFLLRLGIAESLELRFGGQGATYIAASHSSKRIVGFSPLVIDCKIHVSGSRDDLWVPATGLEIYLQTNAASQDLKTGYQFGINALFSHDFPHKLNFEWNAGFGFTRYKKYDNADDAFGLVNWCLTQDITPAFSLFFDGEFTSKISCIAPKFLTIGVGWQWIIVKRFELFGAFNGTFFHDTNPYLFNMGFMVAF